MMILPGFPSPILMGGGSSGVIMMAADLGSNIGYEEGDGGSLSGTLLPGYVVTRIRQSKSNFGISVLINGNAEAALAGLTGLKINSTICPVDDAPDYDGSIATLVSFDGDAITLVASTSYTVQLV